MITTTRSSKHPITEAISYFEQAFFLARNSIARGIAAALLARTYWESGDKEHFLDAMESVLYVQVRTASFPPTLNPAMTHEIQGRGLLNAGQVNTLPSLLKQDTSHFLTIPIAPQWHVISQLTRAEALIRLGKIDDGLANLKTALIGTELCRLPHEVHSRVVLLVVIPWSLLSFCFEKTSAR